VNSSLRRSASKNGYWRATPLIPENFQTQIEWEQGTTLETVTRGSAFSNSKSSFSEPAQLRLKPNLVMGFPEHIY
jgi:hypothetical protein